MATAFPFSSSTPDGPVVASNYDDQMRSDKGAIAERLNLEHYFSASSAAGEDQTLANANGRHRPGYTSAVYIGTSVSISLLLGVKSGALAYDTTLSQLQIYNGANWTTYTLGSSVGLLSPNLNLSGLGTTSGTWATSPANVDRALDTDDWADAWDTSQITSVGNDIVLMYWDLGADYSGYLLGMFGVRAGGTGTMKPTGIRIVSDTDSANLVALKTASSPTTIRQIYSAFEYAYCGLMHGWTTSTSEVKFNVLIPFYGRYVGMFFMMYNEAGKIGYFNVYRFNAFGVAA